MVCKSQGKNARRWNQAIEDANDTIAKCERKIDSMRAAIKEFERARDEGSPYPGMQVLGHSEGQQHSV